MFLMRTAYAYIRAIHVISICYVPNVHDGQLPSSLSIYNKELCHVYACVIPLKQNETKTLQIYSFSNVT